MTSFSLRALAGGAVVGTAGAALLYSALAPGTGPYAAPIPVPTIVSTTSAPPVYRDCPKGASLERGVCVTRIRRTVTVTSTTTPAVVPAPPAPLPVSFPAPPAPRATSPAAPAAPSSAPPSDAHEDGDGEDQERPEHD